MSTRRVSFADVILVTCLGLIVASIALMQIQRHRMAARKSGCVDNLFQLVLAMHNYHSAYKQMPMGSGGSTAAPDSELWQSNHDRLSAFVGLLPFHDEKLLWKQIVNPKSVDEITFPSMGPAPWYDPKVYTPWSLRPKIMACPADPDAAEFPTVSSYVMNYGDAVHMVGSPYDPDDNTITDAINASNRGLFFGKHVLKFRNILDGLSNTVMFSEACIASKPVAKRIDGMSLNPSLCIAAHKDRATQHWPRGREACWADGCLRSSGFQTILPPNSPSATSKDSDLEGIMSASSHHPGGVHVAMADGVLKFISNSIDAGQSDAPTVALLPGTAHAKPKSESPYGLWGAIGTRASMERIFRDEERLQTPPLLITEQEMAEIKRRPVQVWTRTETGAEIKGQVIAVVDKSLVYWSADENDVCQIPLSKLNPDDAQHAQLYYDRMLDRVILRLKVQITEASKLLNDKDVSSFCDAMMQSDLLNREQLDSLVRENREMLARTLKELVQELNNPESRIVRRRMSADAPLTIHLDRIEQLKLENLVLSYADGHWSIRVK